MAKKRKGSKATGRKVRVDLRKNRGKTVREKGEYTRRFREEDIAQEDAKLVEHVRAKGVLSRKRTVILQDEDAKDTRLRRGTVVAVRGPVAEVDDGANSWACTVRRMLRTRLIKERHPVAVGDVVGFLPEGVIEEVADRKTMLVRQYEQRVQVVAANVDLAVIVVAADEPTLRPHLIDRYLVAAHQGGMCPAICINKMDLDVDGAAAAVAKRYERLGYRSLLTCAIDGRGLDSMRELLSNQTSVLIGPSGAGKSSLLNGLDPDLSLRVGTLTDLRRGRHTTTTARLLRWAFGGYVVDTPGLRQFEPADVEPEELEAYFVEFVDLIHACHFPDCSHTHEADCAVKAAVKAGQVASERYESYCRMYDECTAKREY
ncbi:MAG: ribosome small subunit-dependent GTPase A [Phycisphaerae bacterium]|nr:ribosome small subunit-dependent GTPase A [Phycisphaerae bacterium]